MPQEMETAFFLPPTSILVFLVWKDWWWFVFMKNKNILFKSRLYSFGFFSPAAAELCKQNNGGCHKAADCTQHGVKVFCSCQKGYKGDGFTCLPINPCADGFNGGCHEHAICTVTGPVSRIISVPSREVWGVSSWCQQKSPLAGSCPVPL